MAPRSAPVQTPRSIGRKLHLHERADAIAAMLATYAAAGVELFAAWVHEADTAMQSDLERGRGGTHLAGGAGHLRCNAGRPEQDTSPSPEARGRTMPGLLMLLPIAGIAWWLLGFPPGWGWMVLPMLPPMPVSFGMLLVLGTVVVGCYGSLVWARNHL